MKALFNPEAAHHGEAQALYNLREREDCLAAVGNPVPAGSIPEGHRLLAIDDTHYITTRENAIAIDGNIVATVTGEVLHARVMGRFVIISTKCECVVLHRQGNNYVRLVEDEAIPMVSLTASATSRFTATVPPVTFETPYRDWQAPLAAQDRRTMLSAVTTAWRDALAAASTAGRHCGPMLVRYGVRLWDDNYLWMSQPVVVGGASIHNHYRAALAVSTGNSQFTGTQQGTLGLDAYALDITALDTIAAAWRPLVKAVDVLATRAVPPVGSSLDYRCAFDSSHVPILEAGLKPRPDSQLWDDLYRASWTVIASAAPSPDGTLTFSRVTTPSMQFTNARLAPLMAHMAWEQRECATLVHDGRLHLAPQYRLPVNPWRLAPWCEAMTGTPCEATVTVTLADEQGERRVTTHEQLSGTPTALNALITYPDVRATHIAVNAGTHCWEADLVPWQEAGLAMAVATSWEGHAIATGTLTTPSGDESPLAVRAVLEVSEVQNPFVFTTMNVGLHHDIIAMATVVTPLYNGGFGRYPIYLFTSGGIHALAQGAKAYGSTRPLSELIIDSTLQPVTGGSRVWFFDKEHRLCALQGAKAEVMSYSLDVSSFAWNSMEQELVVCGTSLNMLPTRMPSGRFYYRQANWEQVFSDEAHALAVDPGGQLYDLHHEDTSQEMEVEYCSMPILTSDHMHSKPNLLLWTAHAHDAQFTFRILGTLSPGNAACAAERGLLGCPRDITYLITQLHYEAQQMQTLAMRVPPLPQRTFTIEISAYGRDITLHPTLILKS